MTAPWITYRPQLKVLDCTIRDGGLINDHQFEDGFVKAVYNACVESGIDYMEIGYKNSKRLYSKDQFGAWKHCDEDDIRDLHWLRVRDDANGTTLWRHDFDDETIGDDPSEHNYWTCITNVTEGHPSLPDGTPLTPANLGYGPGDVVPLVVDVYYRDDWFNYTETRHLRVNVGHGPFPWPEDWYGGDTHYHTLGLDLDATPEQIETAYQELKERFQPAVSQPWPEDLRHQLEQVIKKIRKAYAILSKPDRKRAYDFLLDNLDEEF